MKKLWELNYSQKFLHEGVEYYVYGTNQRVSQTSIVRMCINTLNGTIVELNANLEIELINK